MEKVERLRSLYVPTDEKCGAHQSFSVDFTKATYCIIYKYFLPMNVYMINFPFSMGSIDKFSSVLMELFDFVIFQFKVKLAVELFGFGT